MRATAVPAARPLTVEVLPLRSPAPAAAREGDGRLTTMAGQVAAASVVPASPEPAFDDAPPPNEGPGDPAAAGAPAEPGGEVHDAQGALPAAPEGQVEGLPVEEAPATTPPTSTPPALPRPRRDYPIPTPPAVPVWPFTPQVYRWQPLVEAELAALRRLQPIDPAITIELVLAVITAESGGDPLAVSSATASGLMQVLPTTFAEVLGDGDVFDPAMNIRAGILYLHRSIVRHEGDVDWALAGYHAGIAASVQARAGQAGLLDLTVDYVTYV
jgi:soluble lytic murein transglycosylase-like protein